MKKKYTAAVCAILLAALSACGEAAQKPSESPAATDAQTEIEISDDTESLTEETRPPLKVPDADFGGAEFVIMALERGADGQDAQFPEFSYDAERSGEGINDAVYQRNSVIEEKYNVKIIVSEQADSGKLSSNLKKIVSAGDQSVYAATPLITDAMSLAQNGMLADLNGIKEIDQLMPWWDQNIRTELSVGGKVYAQAGDLLMSPKELQCFLGVNAKLLKDNGMEMPYSDVESGVWTIDRMASLTRGITRDLNGDGKLDENDIFGYTHTPESAYWMFCDAGGKIASLENGVPKLSGNSARNQEILDKLCALYSDKETTLDVNKMSNTWTTNREMFVNDQVAIQPASVYVLQTRRDMVTDFGILPYPKYDENQSDYMNFGTIFRMRGISIPVTCPDAGMTGTLLEALAYHSEDTVLKAYYEHNLQGKVSRDDESRRMLEIIFTTIHYDLIDTFRWGDMFSAVCGGIADSSSFASKYAKTEEKTVKAMEKTYQAITGNE